VVTLRAGVTGAGIQRALDGLPKAGGEVLLPAGRVDVSRPIVLQRDNQELRGTGPATVLRLADNADCPVIILGEPVDHPGRTVKNLRLSGVYIDGNRLHQRNELWQLAHGNSEIHNNGITVQDVSDSTVTDVTCAHSRSGGFVTSLGVRRLTVRNLEAFDSEFDGLACYLTTDSRFVGLYLHDNRSAGISLDLDFDHNLVSDAVLAANDLGIFMRSSRNNRFQNVSIRNSRHFGVFIAQSELETPRGWRPLAHTECTGNSFTNLHATGCGSAAFHIDDTSCTGNVVLGTTASVAFLSKSAR
jgi:polygalacturonase